MIGRQQENTSGRTVFENHAGTSVCRKNLAEFRRRSGEIKSDDFRARRVRARKYFSGCKRRTVRIRRTARRAADCKPFCQKRRNVFFDKLRPPAECSREPFLLDIWCLPPCHAAVEFLFCLLPSNMPMSRAETQPKTPPRMKGADGLKRSQRSPARREAKRSPMPWSMP